MGSWEGDSIEEDLGIPLGVLGVLEDEIILDRIDPWVCGVVVVVIVGPAVVATVNILYSLYMTANNVGG